MKPKDLKTPFTWEERRPLLEGNVLHVPTFYDKHEEFSYSYFENDQPLHVEYCSGNGEWIAEKAMQNPHINWISVEKQFVRVRKLWSKSQNRQIKNLLIVCGLAQDFTRCYLKNHSVDQFYVNFPDPWPKKSHAKHRLIQSPFIDLISEKAKPGAVAEFVTDDLPYATQMQTLMDAHPAWTGQMSILGESHGPSFFDRLWRGKNRTIRKLTYDYNRT